MGRAGGVLLLVAVAACQAPPAELAPADASAPPADAPPPPTWHGEVAGIVRARCAGCHALGGAAPFPLETYAQVAPRAALVRAVTAARIMPPWPAESSGAC